MHSPKQKAEAAELQKLMDKEGKGEKLEAWDWWYYTEKLRKEKYNLEEEEIKPYFKLENVREGAFAVANKLYGITLTKLEGIPVYHPDVEVFEVKAADGSQVGIFYVDYFPRPGKSGWCLDEQLPRTTRQHTSIGMQRMQLHQARRRHSFPADHRRSGNFVP